MANQASARARKGDANLGTQRSRKRAAMLEAKRALEAAQADPTAFLVTVSCDWDRGVQVGATEAGEPVGIFPGTITYRNTPGHAFDYRVRVEVDGHDAGSVELVSVETMKRADGPRMTVRALQDDGPGWFHRDAVKRCTRAVGRLVPGKVHGDDLEPVVTHFATAPKPGRAPGVTTAELDAVRELVLEAERRGLKMHDHVRRGLAERFPPPGSAERWTTNHAKYRVGLARTAGLLPPAKRGRPSR